MKTNWIFAGAVTWFIAVIVPVIHNGMLTIAHEIHFIGSVMHKAEFSHISQTWASPFRNLPFLLEVYVWGMLALGAIMILVGFAKLKNNKE